MKASPRQIEQALLHATVWEEAASNLSEKIHSDPSYIEKSMGVTVQQLKAQMWLAMYVGGEYRKIVNGAEITP